MTTQSAAFKRMIAARTALVLDQPFWGTLALRLQMVEDPTCDTAWVDGKTFGFNPEFVATLTTPVLKALVAHEVSHCVLGHPWRRGSRDLARWNEACDRALNPLLRNSNFRLPEGALFELEPSHRGKSAEWIFNRLPTATPESTGEGEGEGGGGKDAGDDIEAEEQMESSAFPDEEDAKDSSDKPFGGEVRDAPAPKEDDDEDTTAEEDAWKQAVQQAAQLADSQGKLPGGLKRAVDKAAQAMVDWRSVLRRFPQEVARSDYSWTTPNRRYLAQGLYLPALQNRELGPLVIAVDTSGSIDNTLLAMFNAEVQAVVEESQPRRVHVLYCDTKIQEQETFERGELVSLHPCGGGGTNFRPVFAALADLEEPPACLIYLTDLLGTFPEEDPGLPVLWATPRYHAQTQVPFGEVVAIEE